MQLKHIGRRATMVAAACAVAALTLGATAGANATTPSVGHGATVTVQKAHNHKVVMPKRGAIKPHAAASNLLYGGGPVERNPKVYLVFWGSQWNSDGNGVQSYLTNFFSGVGSSSDTWSTILS